MDNFAIAPKTIDRAIRRVPEADLTSASHDRETATPATDLLLVLSTPRSGSTLLSDLIDRSGLCCPAEYYQPFEYVPLLASRWDCLRDGALDHASFAQKLRQYRTSETGWLGIKLHPKHFPLFDLARTQFADLRWHAIHLVRRDLIAQAVSYHIADGTQKWSSAFPSDGEVEYAYAAIRQRLYEINEGNAFLQAASASLHLNVKTIYYEDLVKDPEGQLACVPGIRNVMDAAPETGLERQGNPRNEKWATRFAAEYKAECMTNYTRDAMPQSSIAKRLLGWLF